MVDLLITGRSGSDHSPANGAQLRHYEQRLSFFDVHDGGVAAILCRRRRRDSHLLGEAASHPMHGRR